MKIKLAYGEGRLEVEFPQDRSVVIEPTPIRDLPDERAALMAALDQPIGAPPLRQLVSKSSRVTIVFTDITRATPNDRLIPWLLDYLSGLIPRENITLLNGLGTHRPNTRAELEKLLTPGVVENYRVLNHEPENPAAHVQLGVTRDGTPALLNRHLVEADVRIITGFIEPHFFAGFSGGPKGIMPGVARLADGDEQPQRAQHQRRQRRVRRDGRQSDLGGDAGHCVARRAEFPLECGTR